MADIAQNDIFSRLDFQGVIFTINRMFSFLKFFRKKPSMGEAGERLAERFLKKKGYRLVERNWRRKAGEVDLLMQDGEVLVVVEVKSRASDWWRFEFVPADSVEN